jgi:hypothetical protein
MPYLKIQSDPEIYNIFLSYMEKGIRTVFEQYNINQSQLEAIFFIARKEIIGNPEYFV